MRAVRPRVVHLQRCPRWATLSASPSAEDLHTQNSRRVGPMARPQGPPPPPAGSEAAHGVVSICRWECVDVAAHHPVSGERGPRARGCARSLQPQTNHTSPTGPSLLVAPQLRAKLLSSDDALATAPTPVHTVESARQTIVQPPAAPGCSSVARRPRPHAVPELPVAQRLRRGRWSAAEAIVEFAARSRQPSAPCRSGQPAGQTADTGSAVAVHLSHVWGAARRGDPSLLPEPAEVYGRTAAGRPARTCGMRAAPPPQGAGAQYAVAGGRAEPARSARLQEYLHRRWSRRGWASGWRRPPSRCSARCGPPIRGLRKLGPPA